MYKSILAASIAVLTAAGEANLDNLNLLNAVEELNLVRQQEAADTTESNLMNALIRKIMDVEAENIRLNGNLSNLSQELDVLNSKSIVEDYFFSNTEDIVCPYNQEEMCFDVADVDAGETFEFSADIKLIWAATTHDAMMYGKLLKGNEMVAVNIDDRGLPAHIGQIWQN